MERRDEIVVSLHKGKGIKSACSSYRPISLLSVPGKVFAHVLLARLQPLLERTKRPHQSGFTRGRSTIDAILALRLLSEILTHREFNRSLHVAYVDIKAAFDSVARVAFWRALKGKGVPHLVLQLYWRTWTFTPKQAQRCVQAGSYQAASIVRRTPGVRIGTRLILHSHRLDTEPSSTTSWYHSWRTMLHVRT